MFSNDFKKRLQKKLNGKTVYFDSDGVVFDFNREPNALKRFATEKGFFKYLKPIKDNYRFLNWLKANGFSVKILSASPNVQADNDKMVCFREYLPTFEETDFIICRNTDTKLDFIEDIDNAIMVDDYTMNLIPIKLSGGKSIKYLGVGDSPVGRHTQLGIPHITEMKEIIDFL